MRARSIAAFLALTLVVPAFSAPVPTVEVNALDFPESQEIEVRDLEARAFAAHYTFSGDEVGPVKPPSKPPTTPRAQNKERAKQQARAAVQQSVATRVQAVLDQAGPALHLPQGLTVDIYSTFHASRSDGTHATFRFNAPVCGGTCVGHAYQTNQGGYPGRIFSASHAVIYGPH